MAAISNICGKYFIWKPEDACAVRERERVIGSLCGCLPRQPRQNLYAGLPLELSAEEVNMLVHQVQPAWSLSPALPFADSDTHSKSLPPTTDCQVFASFWQQGFTLTRGGKFGGDYLVYPGDPSRFHSFYIVVCLKRDEALFALDLIRLGRLASHVKKAVVLCTVDSDHRVHRITLQWSKMS